MLRGHVISFKRDKECTVVEGHGLPFLEQKLKNEEGEANNPKCNRYYSSNYASKGTKGKGWVLSQSDTESNINLRVHFKIESLSHQYTVKRAIRPHATINIVCLLYTSDAADE